MQKSWKTYQKNAAPFAVGAFIILLFMAAALSLSFVLMFKNPQAMLAEEYLDIETSELMPLGIIVIVLAGLFGIVLQTGLYGMALESTSRKTSLETMAKVLRKSWKQSMGAFLMIGMSYIFIILLFMAVPAALFASSGMQYMAIFAGLIGIFLLSVLFSMVYPSLAAGKSAFVSIEESVSMAKKDFLGIAAVMIVFSLISLVSREIFAIVPSVGIVIGIIFSTMIIMPWQSVAFSCIYRKLSGKRN